MKKSYKNASLSEVVKGITCPLSLAEKDDCAVTAFAAACDVYYTQAHEFVEKHFHREPRKGLDGMEDVLENIFHNKVLSLGRCSFKFFCLSEKDITSYYKVDGEPIRRRMTVKSFLQIFNKGSFIILVRGHVFAIVDGVLIDHPDEHFRPTRIVESAVRVTKVQNIGTQLEIPFPELDNQLQIKF